MTISDIKSIVCHEIVNYPVTKVTLFGSRASGTHKPDSDVDLVVEFSEPISLLTLSSLRLALEDALQLKVDLIHGPWREDDIIEPGKEIILYAA